MLSVSAKLVFCTTADRNGHVTTDDRKHDVPQRRELARDTAHSRYRRIVNGRHWGGLRLAFRF
jgi:methyl-accepting chemotaxis protein